MSRDPSGRGTSAWVTAIRERQIPGTKKLLLMVLADYVNGDDECYPGTVKLAPEVGIAHRTVQVLLSSLEEQGVIEREVRPIPSGRGRGVTMIRLVFAGLAAAFPFIGGPRPNAESALSPEDQTQSDDDQTQKSDDQTQPGRNRTSLRNHKEPPDEPRAKARRHPIPHDFAPGAELRAWAAEKVPAVDVEWETEKFIDHWRAKGETKVDWAAAWRFWMRNATSFGRPGPKVANTPAATAAFEEYKRRRARRTAG